MFHVNKTLIKYKAMKNYRVLSRSEVKQIQGGGPISDWVACKVNSFIESWEAWKTSVANSEGPPADYDAAMERWRRGSVY
jgi:hypothetical protein